MEEKDAIHTEHAQLRLKHREAQQLITRLKRTSAEDANRYEQLLDRFREENSSAVDEVTERIQSECEKKMAELNADRMEAKGQLEQAMAEREQREEAWNHKFDLVVAERNALKRKAKSLQRDLSATMRAGSASGSVDAVEDQNRNHRIRSPSLSVDADELKTDTRKDERIARLESELSEMRRNHKAEKSALIQRMSSNSTQSKGSDMQFLVNSLSNLITEKEEIIESLTKSKQFLGHRLLEMEQELRKRKQ